MPRRQKQASGTQTTSAKPGAGQRARKQRKRNAKARGMRDVPVSAAQLKSDPRTAAATNTGVVMSNTQNAITMPCAWSAQALFGMVIAYISKAMERGFGGSASSTLVPFYAAQFMYVTLANAQQGNFPQASQLPYWLLALCRAISPKKASLGSGSISYQWNSVDPTLTMPVSVPIGYIPYGYHWFNGYADSSTLVDGFPIVNLTGFTGYTPELGANAFNELVQFMSVNVATSWQKKLSESVPLSTVTSLDKDVSAFAVGTQSLGTGVVGNDGGGIGMLLENEVPIRTPLLSLTGALPDTVTSYARFYNFSRVFAGDQIFLSGMMSTVIPEFGWKFKALPRFYPVDFIALSEVLALWMQKVLQAYYNATPAASIPTGGYPCPLTLQEVQLLLRNTLMGAFKDSQFAVQSIYPIVPLSDTDNQFVPFVSSLGTCPLQTLDMILPQPFIENIRALTAMRVMPPNRNGKQDASRCEYYYPVLGQYATDLLQWQDFVATFTTGESPPVEIQVFADPSVVYKKKREVKGVVEVVPLAETVISFVDGNSSAGPVAINDPGRLKQLVSIWNDWIQGPVASFTVSLGTYSSENGIPVLRSLGMHRQWYNGQVSLLRRRDSKASTGEKSRTDQTFVDARLVKKKTRVASVYSNRFAAAVTSVGPLLAAPYENVQNVWELPTQQIEAESLQESSLVPRTQALYREVNLTPTTTGQDGVSLYDLHDSYASKMVKAQLAESSDWSNTIKTFSAKGEGGILSGLIGSLVSAAFPAASGVVDAVASVLPV